MAFQPWTNLINQKQASRGEKWGANFFGKANANNTSIDSLQGLRENALEAKKLEPKYAREKKLANGKNEEFFEL